MADSECAPGSDEALAVRVQPAPKDKDGKQKPWRLYASFLGNKGRSAEVEIRVDRNLDPVEERRQASLRKMGVSTREHLKCYFRLLFSSGAHARASLAPLLNFIRQDTGWGEAQRSNCIVASSFAGNALPKVEFVSSTGVRFFMYRSKGTSFGRHSASSQLSSSGSDSDSGEDSGEQTQHARPVRFLGM